MPEGDAIFEDDALPEDMEHDTDDLKESRDDHDESDE